MLKQIMSILLMTESKSKELNSYYMHQGDHRLLMSLKL